VGESEAAVEKLEKRCLPFEVIPSRFVCISVQILLEEALACTFRLLFVSEVPLPILAGCVVDHGPAVHTMRKSVSLVSPNRPLLRWFLHHWNKSLQ
jgi:hypothetical protein